MNKNYHTHTTRCGHAKGTEREYIECAIQNGFKVLGFSDHTPQPYPDSYVSGMRMKMDQLDEYVDTLVNLRDEYKDQIKILIGLETEYYPKYFDKLHEELKARPIDYIIMGQHHVPDEIEGFYSGEETTSEDRLKAYVDLVIEGLSTGYFTYLAHPDLINYEGPDEIFQKHTRRICEFSLEHNIPLEINMLGFERGIHYPSDRFFSMASKMGCKFVIGCDAHEPHLVMQPEALPGFMEFLDRNNINYSQDIDIRAL